MLIHDDVSPRLKWKMGVIMEVFKCTDDVVRSVKLRTANGYTNRPISKLYPLEIQAQQPEQESELGTSIVPARPKRVAAEKALAKIKGAYNG